MNHDEFIEAIAATIGTPPLPGTPRWKLQFPHGGELTIQPAGDHNPYVFMQVLGWPAESFPGGANQFTGVWNISPSFNEGCEEPVLYKQCLKELQRRLALIDYVPPGDPAAVPAEGGREAGLAEDDGSWKVSVDDGKYTVCFDGKGKLSALRYGEPWQDLVGNNLVYWLAVELREAREARAGLSDDIGQRAAEISEAILESLRENNPGLRSDAFSRICEHVINAIVEFSVNSSPMEEGDEEHPLWCLDAQIRGLLEGDGASEDLEAVKDFFRAAGLPESTAARVRDALCSAEVKPGLTDDEKETVSLVLQARIEDAEKNSEGMPPCIAKSVLNNFISQAKSILTKLKG